MTTLHCPTCRDQRPVEQPPCLDSHADCPEWICIDCGTAIVVGWLSADTPAAAARLVATAA